MKIFLKTTAIDYLCAFTAMLLANVVLVLGLSIAEMLGLAFAGLFVAYLVRPW